VEDISGIVGRGGYEGIQADAHGNLWIVEDAGGRAGAVNKNARQPNSFIYRFVPKNKQDLKGGGKLQALQVASKRHVGPIIFNPDDPDSDILSLDVKDLHSYGVTFDAKWIDIHDTDVDGIAPFDANAAAKIKQATPFKRPENGVFRPGTGFREFYFTETGDTNKDTEAGADFGGFGGIFKLSQKNGSSDSWRLTIFYKSDVAHTGFDNIAFWSKSKFVVAEDAGDRLHTQRNALDSAYLFDADTDYTNPAIQPVRILAQGRDPSATFDSPLANGRPDNGFQNDGDNEITGIHISDGDASVHGILGARNPRPFREGWRLFYTQQHGDNVTYEIVPAQRIYHDQH
jgi:secreted PhoX family phosphatase